MSNIFDNKVFDDTEENSDAAVAEPSRLLAEYSGAILDSQHTSTLLKRAVQELLKFGLLDVDRKPNLYTVILTQRDSINRILEPLDIKLKIDDIRGLAFLAIAPSFISEQEEWSHPLVRRQRLTLEQSLLIAILRQMYLIHEQEQGFGAGAAPVYLDDLLPQLQLYLGETGSDLRDQKRLRNLLESLEGHGIVSNIDEQERFTIRPIIAHLADPESLKSLLVHFRALATNHVTENVPAHDEEKSE